MIDVNDFMVSKIVDDKIVIEIPIDLLVFAIENRSFCSVKITNKQKMAQYVAKNILTYVEDQETGISAFEQFLDNLFDDAFECAEEWIIDDDL